MWSWKTGSLREIDWSKIVSSLADGILPAHVSGHLRYLHSRYFHFGAPAISKLANFHVGNELQHTHTRHPNMNDALVFNHISRLRRLHFVLTPVVFSSGSRDQYLKCTHPSLTSLDTAPSIDLPVPTPSPVAACLWSSSIKGGWDSMMAALRLVTWVASRAPYFRIKAPGSEHHSPNRLRKPLVYQVRWFRRSKGRL